MPKFDPDDLMTPEQRRAAIAATLARGVIRAVRARRAEEAVGQPVMRGSSASVLPSQKSFPHPQIPLELSAETRLSVATGSGG